MHSYIVETVYFGKYPAAMGSARWVAWR